MPKNWLIQTMLIDVFAHQKDCKKYEKQDKSKETILPMTSTVLT